ncbi:CLUMA_CG019548, isoform A [Clunio marinus]|uniref:CLUMA_CG019548, isoform A n=1 Tax=Clunio marinus TaxID=568069 RepID=A0A1J1J4J9_9DIPT|nr:CLUMA_CG019548, isoform A [Clunio marinus]
MMKTFLIILVLCHCAMSKTIQNTKADDLMSTETSSISVVNVLNIVKTEAQIFFENIPFQDQDDFIAYFLGRGLQMNHIVIPEEILQKNFYIEAFEQLVNPQRFSQDLLESTKEEFELDNEEMTELVLYNRVCFSSGRCVSITDVGVHCCLV